MTTPHLESSGSLQQQSYLYINIALFVNYITHIITMYVYVFYILDRVIHHANYAI
jgi:hypothetical protein